MLDADVALEQRVPGVRDIAGGENAGEGGSQLLVDDDSVLNLRARCSGQVDFRGYADADHGEVAVDYPTTGRANPFDGALAFERLHAITEDQLEACRACTSR